jgi:hypothetical protein
LIDNKDNYGVGMSDSSGIFFPMVEGKADETANNKIQIGSSTNRFSEIYSVKALNTTSDQNLKENVEYFDERYEKAYMEFKPCTFTYRNFTESDCHDRRHFGLLSQPTEAVLLSNGICLDEAGFICKDSLETPNEAGQMIQYSMRYGELTALNMHMIQKAYLEISKLQNTISELENQIAELKKAGA